MNCNKCIHNDVCEHWKNAIFGSDTLYPKENECEHFEPVRHGEWEEERWVWTKAHAGWRCSECKGRQILKYNYCPECGAKMDGGSSNG